MRSDRLGTVRDAPSAYVYGAGRRTGWLLKSATAAGVAVLAGSLVGAALRRATGSRAPVGEPRSRSGRVDGALRRVHDGASILALSVLADSAVEHYRARFDHRTMYAAPTVAGATLATALHASAVPRARTRARPSVYAGAAVTGVVGAGFHLRNVTRGAAPLRDGGGRMRWSTLLYGAPLGAPLAISLAGVLGLAAGALRDARGGRAGDAEALVLLGLPAGRVLAAVSSLGLLGTSAEVALLHFRGAFQNPFMYVPVVLPPLAALALAANVVRPGRRSLGRATRALLRTTAAVGLAGVGFHAYGIERNMGGFRNWSQMILQGPPVPAPPAFTGLALSGLSALELMEERA